MVDFALTPDGDLDLSSGTIRLTEDGSPEELAQRIRQRLHFIRGEWFLDRSAGVPYWQVVLTTNPNLAHIRAAYSKELRETDGVGRLAKLDIEYDRAARLLSVSATVNNRLEIAEEMRR